MLSKDIYIYIIYIIDIYTPADSNPNNQNKTNTFFTFPKNPDSSLE